MANQVGSQPSQYGLPGVPLKVAGCDQERKKKFKFKYIAILVNIAFLGGLVGGVVAYFSKHLKIFFLFYNIVQELSFINNGFVENNYLST